MLTKDDLAKWFDEAWREETYSPPWSKAVSELSAEQAAWTPAPGRHSIWQIVEHMSFWREYKLREMAGEERDEEEIARRNWPVITDTSGQAWEASVARLGELQQQLTDAMASSDENARQLKNFLEHAAYHMGQIMYLRALQGLPPLDSFG